MIGHVRVKQRITAGKVIVDVFVQFCRDVSDFGNLRSPAGSAHQALRSRLIAAQQQTQNTFAIFSISSQFVSCFVLLTALYYFSIFVLNIVVVIRDTLNASDARDNYVM